MTRGQCCARGPHFRALAWTAIEPLRPIFRTPRRGARRFGDRRRASGGSRSQERHGRAAARCGAWRPCDQCGDGSGQARRHQSARAGRSHQAQARSPSAGHGGRYRGPGIHQPRLERRRLARRASDDPRRGRRLWPVDDRQATSGSMSNMSRPTRPARCTWAIAAARSSATAWPGCSRRRASGSPRNIMSTMRARRSIRSPARSTCVTAKRWARTSATFPEGMYPGDYLKPVGVQLAADIGDHFRDCAGGRMAVAVPRGRDQGDARPHPARPRPARNPPRYFLVRSRAAGVRARSTAPWTSCCAQGLGLRRRARAAQKPRSARRVGAGRADPVPVEPVRRRPGSADEEVGRQLDLFRRRRRLSFPKGAEVPTIWSTSGAPTTPGRSSASRRRSRR